MYLMKMCFQIGKIKLVDLLHNQFIIKNSYNYISIMDPEIQACYNNALFEASENELLEVVQYLIQQGATL